MPAYPYVSSLNALPKVMAQFRKSMPQTVNAQTLQKFAIAPKNESYVINTIRFLGLIDSDGNRIQENTEFLFHDDDSFRAGLEERIKAAYSELFADFGDDAFEKDKPSLVTWFRTTDKVSEIVGGRQASTFQVLSAIAGHGEPPAVQPAQNSKPPVKSTTKKASAKKTAAPEQPAPQTKPLATSPVHQGGLVDSPLGLTVRVEVTLPPNGTPEIYDSIFASIRKHLIDRE